MSESVLNALIGGAGTIVGAVAAVLVTQLIEKWKRRDSTEKETETVLGNAVDIQELRILRALFGEPRGRYMEGYKGGYYRPYLNAVIQKRKWVEQNDKLYNLTPEGAKFCWEYLKGLKSWSPAGRTQNP